MMRWSLLGICLAVTQLIALVAGLEFFEREARLPAPFFYNAADTFMDFFHTNYWSGDNERYSTWNSIYPPFSFALGNLFTSDACQASPDPFALRDCSIRSISFLIALHAVNAVLSTLLWARHNAKAINSRTQLILALFVFAFLMPSLYALERGNYIILCITLLLLFSIDRNPIRRSIYLALAINIKQYLAILVLPLIFKRKLDQVLLITLFGLGIHLASLVFIGETLYPHFIGNMFQFAQGSDFSQFEKMWYTNSISAWSRVLDRLAISNPDMLGGNFLSFSVALSFLRAGVVLIFLITTAVIIRSESSLKEGTLHLYLTLFLVATVESIGGYASALLVPFLITSRDEPLEGYQRYSPIFLFVMMTPLDFNFGPDLEFTAESFLTGQPSRILASLTAGSYLRPLCGLALFCLLSYSIIKWNKLVKTKGPQ